MTKFGAVSKIITIAAFVISTAATASPNNYSMNGYTADQFGDFTKNWRLVTVRFRKDTGEMRWTYANESAWKTLAENKTNYPDGAVFAKVGVMTKDDISFPSSAVPSGARRVQFMVKNQKKHADTEGWGYALFDADGKTFPGDEKEATFACAACHRIVPDRGYVFSQIAGFTPAALKSDQGWQKHLKFKNTAVSKLPKKLKSLLPPGMKSVRLIDGDLSKNLFPGTLDEIRPLLAQESMKSKLPTALVEDSGKRFSVVVPRSEPEACAAGETPMKGAHTVSEDGEKLFELNFCQAALN